MGSSQSSCLAKGISSDSDLNFIMNLLMPVYYVSDEVTEVDLDSCRKTWCMVAEDTSPIFLRKFQEPNFKHSNCLMWFCELYFSRLFDIHPLCRPMFSMVGLFAQGNFLVKLMSMCLSPVAENDKLRVTLSRLAEAHNERGVKAIEYGIIGEVLFWSLKQALGEEIMDVATTASWMAVFSRLLRVMVPVALNYELKNGSAQEERSSHILNHLVVGNRGGGDKNDNKKLIGVGESLSFRQKTNPPSPSSPGPGQKLSLVGGSQEEKEKEKERGLLDPVGTASSPKENRGLGGARIGVEVGLQEVKINGKTGHSPLGGETIEVDGRQRRH